VRNALLPIATLMGFELAALFTGSIILETLLGIPGIGLYVRSRSVAAITTVSWRSSSSAPSSSKLAMLVVDVAYVFIDPRIRLRGGLRVSQAELATGTLETSELRPASQFRVCGRLLRRPVAVAAIIIILTIYVAGILAPLIAPFDFDKTDLRNTFAGPSSEHWLGTDRLGRDVLSRLIWSAQTTVIISALTVVGGSLILGVSLGLISGYFAGRVDNVIMRAADALYSVPTLLLILIINATLKARVDSVFRDLEDITGIGGLARSGAPNIFLLSVALSIFGWVGMARLVRSQVLSLREANYVLAARALGSSTPRILSRHLLPQLTNLMVVTITLTLGAVALAEVSLTFLGVGVQDHASFGIMISQYAGVTNVRAHPLLLFAPAIIVALLMLSFNLLGDALTDVLSPRRR
jgi:ABC-type dipeptide/oligopeptide/nickel transport system permease subunit